MANQDLKDVYLFKIETTAKQFKKYKNAILKEHDIDITSDQWILLKNINEIPGISQSELAKRCRKEPAAVTRTLDILVRKTWIKRESIPDNRRMYELYTTPNGEKMIQKILPVARKIRSRGARGMTATEMKTLGNLLDRIQSNLQ